MSHLTLALDRTPGTPAVRVYSPDFEEHGFGSPHTVVDIVTDDMPFVVDSVTTEVIRHGLGLHLTVHPVVAVRRDEGRIVDILDPHDPASGTAAESFVHLEVDRQTDAAVLDDLSRDVVRVLGDVRAAVEDWSAMRERALAVADTVDVEASSFDEEDRKEAAALLRWLADDHFTFLGYREYELGTDGGGDTLCAVPGTGLGLLRDSRSRPVSHSFAKLPPEVRQKAREPVLLNLTKANSRSTVHKPNYLDYVGVKLLGPEDDDVREQRFLGLMASAAYRQSPREIPVLRRKVQAVLDRAGYPLNSYDGRMLLNILESYPREELFQIDADELYEAATAILDIQDRQRLRLLVRRDMFGRFMSCLVYLPRDRLTTGLRTRIQDILQAAFHGVSTQYATQVSESVLARLHITVQTEPGAVPEYDVAEVEARLVAAMRSWGDDVYDALVDQLGEEHGVALHDRYAEAFPPAYQHDTSAAAAVVDIGRMEGLGGGDDVAMHLYRPLEAAPGTLRFKLFRHGQSVTLSDVLPLLENMGVHVVDERPYEVRPAGAEPVWIYDFGLRHDQLTDLESEGMRERFQEAFAMVWRGDLENDGLNRLVLRAGLRGREVAVVRAYAKYLRQVGATFALDYTVATLANNPGLARRLFELFRVRLDPDHAVDRDLAAKHVVHDFEGGLDAVTSLNEDRVLRALLRVVEATLRTNYFQAGPDGARQAMARDQARLGPDPRPAPPAAGVRDLRLLAPGRGRPPARWVGRPRRPALVGPAGGLPHGGARADEGADGEERRHRAGRRQGRLRRQAPAQGPGRAAGRGRRLLLDLHPRAARRDGQPRGRRGRPARARRALRRGRRVPGRGGRQGHRDLLRHRQRHLPGVRVLDGRRLRLRWLGRLRPQGDGHHGARRLGLRAAPLPRPRRRRAERRRHGRRHRGHVRRRLRQRDAAVGAHPPGGGLRPPARLPRPRSRPGGLVRRAHPAVRRPRFQLGGLRRIADLGRGRSLPPDGEDRPAVPGGPVPAGRHRTRPSPRTS